MMSLSSLTGSSKTIVSFKDKVQMAFFLYAEMITMTIHKETEDNKLIKNILILFSAVIYNCRVLWEIFNFHLL